MGQLKRSTVVLFVMLAVFMLGTTLCLFTSQAFAGSERHGMNPRTYDTWRRNHGRFAKTCAEFDGRIVVVPFYDKRKPSSRGMTVAEARDELTERVREHMFGDGPLKRDRIIKPKPEEAEALAMMLPAMKVGQYGYIHSVEVVEVLGPQDMVVEDTWLIDARAMDELKRADEARARKSGDRNADDVVDSWYLQREALEDQQRERAFRVEYRLTGFPTKGLEKRQRWQGPKGDGLQIALVDIETYQDGRREEHRLVAAPTKVLIRGVGEAGFLKLLEQRGMTPTEFCELFVASHKATTDRREADAAVYEALLPVDPEERED